MDYFHNLKSKCLLFGCICIIIPLLIFGGIEGLIRETLTKKKKTGC
jgi:hypothetical protein